MSNLQTIPNNVTLLQPAVNKNEQGLTSYINFLTKYLNKSFLSNLINCLVYQADLTLIVPSSNNIEIYGFLKQFVYSLTNDLRDNQDINVPKKHYFAILSLLKKLIDVKEDVSFSFINYDNVLKHFNSSDQYVENILQDVVDNPILDNNAFQKLFNDIIQEIQIYNQMQIIKTTIFRWDVFVKDSQSETNSDNNSALNWVKKFKDTIIEANNSLSELVVLKKNESATDYLTFSDEDSIKTSLTGIISFLKHSYRTFKTGYRLFDDNLSGIESSSVTLISGPSNHAKSIFMLNIAKQMIEYYDDKDSDNEAFIFITLEDDINKLFRRILSIFGNYDAAVIKKVFTKASEILRNAEYTEILGKDVIENIESILENITQSSILSVTQGKKKFIIKHSSENSFSMGDASRFIDGLELSGLKVRGVFIDYIDVMTPTSIKQNKQFINDEYVTQGMILHEMRIASRRYGIPIVTITQNNRSSENVSIELSNNQVGDSVKKIRYSDNIIMIRQRPDLDIFSEDVSVDINVDNVTTVNGGDTDLLKYIIPFETKITKAKDGDKGKRQFHIFNHKNLKIYESINEAVAEHKLCVNKSNDLLNQLSIIGLGSIDQSELIFDDNNPFDNLIL